MESKALALLLKIVIKAKALDSCQLRNLYSLCRSAGLREALC